MSPHRIAPHENQWHLSKSIPIAFIVVILLEVGAGVWTASQMKSNISYNARDITESSERIRDLQNQTRSTEIKLGRIEENLKSISSVLEKIDRRLGN